MKKLLSLVVILAAVSLIVTSFKPSETAPKLYPELENYFKSLTTKQFNKEHLEALESMKQEIEVTHIGGYTTNFIFYCSENTFRSQASQVFTQTLCYAKRHRRVNAFSAGVATGEINPKLIGYLTKIGYKISKYEQDGKLVYEIKYADKEDPIKIFSKTTTDKSLPNKDVISVIVCDVKAETDCALLKTESTRPFNLAFPKVTATDEDNKVESTLKNIASEMVYVTGK